VSIFNKYQPKAGLLTTALLATVLAFCASSVMADTAAKRNNNSINPPVERSHPDMTFSDVSKSDKALARLKAAGKMKEFAQFHQTTEADVERIFKNDKSASLDKKGRLFYMEATASGGSFAPANPTIALDQTFLLNSKPGAARTIYLDFNGHTVTGTAWNSSYGIDPINASAFDLDGNAGTFNTTELAMVQNIWRRVSEDYSAFDVNVTTQEPTADLLTRTNSTDNAFGMRVVVSKDWTVNTTAGACGCGGFAYVGVFSMTSEQYKPAFVFYNNLANNEKYIAEAISHEAGHTLGLNHDGTSTAAYYTGHGSGETGWAPIMGVGYYQNLVQWSKGEYANANNTQDDYLLMQNNGLVFAADEHGNSIGAASALTGTATNGLNQFSANGILQGPNDVDFFKFDSAAGSITVNTKPFYLSANTDVLVTLFDINGNVLAQANPADALAANFSFQIPAAGSYYLSVEGTGKPDPYVAGYTKYGSIGSYNVSITAPIIAGNTAPVSRIASSALSGTAPLTVSFNGTNSSDADGSIATYNWNFGDGTTAVGATVSKSYTSAGSFLASLTVTDNAGLSNSSSVTVTVTQPATTVSMSVNSFQMTGAVKGGNYSATASIRIVDAQGRVVPNATVTGSWSGTVSGNASGLTSSTGTASIKSPTTKTRGTMTFTVKSITANGFTYDSTKNVMTSRSITF
jgi:hypothetical protein